MSVFSKSISDAYFTHPESVEFIHNKLNDKGWLGGSILEPCVGSGALVKGLKNVTAWDLNEYDYPLDRVGDFLKQPPERFDLVLTNPPFGYLGHLAADVLNHSFRFSHRIAIVLPQCFRKIQRIDLLDPHFHCVGDYDLPNQNYNLPDGTVKFVTTCFQMWEWSVYKRKSFGTTDYTEFFSQTTKDDADYYLRTQGDTAGIILEGLDHNPNTGRWMKGGRELIEKYDWTTIASFASGAPSIGLQDIAWGLRSPDKESYLKHGITSDLMSGVYDQIHATLPL